MPTPAMLEWRPRALLRFDLLLDEIGQHNPLAAESFGRLVCKKIGLALQFPLLYRSSTRIEGTREIVITRNYFVPYRVTSEALEVLDIVHTRRSWPDPSTSMLTS